MVQKIISYLLVFFFIVQAATAQRPAQDTAKQEGKILEIKGGERINIVKVDSTHTFTSLAVKAHVKQEKTDFYADSMVINEFDNSLEAFGNVHINDADSVHTYAQYVKYLGKEKKAYLKRKVRLTDGKGELTSDELEYDVTLKIGTYLKGGKLVNKKTVLTSKEGYYYGDTKDVLFKQNVVLIDPEYKVVTDTLQYNTSTEIATFTSPTIIYSDSGRRTVKTRQGYFDMKNKRGILNKRSVVEDSTYTFTADDMAIDDSTKLDEFRGNAVYRGKDTAKGFDLIANNIKTNRKKDILLATEKPILLIKQSKDSIFVSADTLYSARLSDLLKTRKVPVVRDSIADTLRPKTAADSILFKRRADSLAHIALADSSNKKDSSSNKYFEAYFHVKIFSDSLQAVCDSLFYSLEDSVFRLFRDPVIWAKQNQITGDTIYLYTKNKKPERLYVFENAMAVGRVDSTIYFNQIKASSINALFDDGNISFVRLKGNAENVYYLQNEKKQFKGMNKGSASMMDVLFDGNSKPKRFTGKLPYDATNYPMRSTNHEEMKLRGFKWLEDLRPKSKFDILGN
ncbi:MAG: OstA family protein [Sediminibacterium sp.]|nr:OstA family protein [Sediminibacterium sp.]